MFKIHEEALADHDAVREVTTAAFAGSPYGHQGEADLVDVLRANCPDSLSLVAKHHDEIVGHILFTPVTIGSRDNKALSTGMGLAPMAVAPPHQRAGIGSALVERGLEQLAADECPFVVVLGDPKFYQRFGFQPATDHGVAHGFAGIPQDVFLIRFHRSELGEALAGPAHYDKNFGPQHETV